MRLLTGRRVAVPGNDIQFHPQIALHGLSSDFTLSHSMKHSILCVDDEIDNVDALERLFRKKYKVLKATSGEEALRHLATNQVSVIISDQRMPHMTGVELLAESIKNHPDAIRILLTGYTDIDSVIAAINNGHVYRYVTKPWDPIDLSNTIDKAIERFELGKELVEKNRALQAALDELQTLDQAKNQFMVLVNHELKTPLTSMLSFTDLLSETKLDLDQKLFVTRIKTAALRLQEMINDSLEFISAETSQMRLDVRPAPTSKLFGEASIPDIIQSAAANRQVRFEFAIENQSVNCDEKLIRNVFRRLLHNAAKFADHGSEVRVTGRSKPDGQYELSVSNSGLPIDEKRISQLLKPFTLNENTMNHTAGTGLGLSICSAMLKLHSTPLRFTSVDRRITVSFDLKIDGVDKSV